MAYTEREGTRDILRQQRMLRDLLTINQGMLFLDEQKSLDKQKRKVTSLLRGLWKVGELFQGANVRLQVPANDLIQLNLVDDVTAERMTRASEILEERRYQRQKAISQDIPSGASVELQAVPHPMKNTIVIQSVPDTSQLVIVQQYHQIAEDALRGKASPTQIDDIIAEACLITKSSRTTYGVAMGKCAFRADQYDKRGEWSLNMETAEDASSGELLALDKKVAADLVRLLPSADPKLREMTFVKEELTPRALNRTFALVTLGLGTEFVTTDALLPLRQRVKTVT